jgi:hypothetical protein
MNRVSFTSFLALSFCTLCIYTVIAVPTHVQAKSLKNKVKVLKGKNKKTRKMQKVQLVRSYNLKLHEFSSVRFTKKTLQVVSGPNPRYSEGVNRLHVYRLSDYKLIKKRIISLPNLRPKKESPSLIKRLKQRKAKLVSLFPLTWRKSLSTGIIKFVRFRKIAGGTYFVEFSRGKKIVFALIRKKKFVPAAFNGRFLKKYAKNEAILVSPHQYLRNQNAKVVMWDFKKNKVLKSFDFSKVTRILHRVSHDGKYLFILTFDYKKQMVYPKLIDLRKKKILKGVSSFGAYPSHCMRFEISPNNKYVVIASGHFGLVFLPLSPKYGNKALSPLKKKGGEIIELNGGIISKDGKYFAVFNSEKLWLYKVH